MATDLRSMVLNMAVNALKQSRAQPQAPPEPKKPHLSTGRAVLLGAGLATAGRALVSARGRDMVESIRDQLAERAGHEDEDYDEPEAEDGEDFEDEEYDEPEAEEDTDEPEDEEDTDEPEAEDDEDFEDEEYDEPEAEEDDDEPEAEDDEDFDEESDEQPEAEEEDEPEERPRRRRARSASRNRA